MTIYKPGDVVLVRFPFTDLVSQKRRPALVVSSSVFSTPHGDLIVIPLTSRAQEHGLCLAQWREAGLLKPTWFKALIATVAGALVEKPLGKIHPSDYGKVASIIHGMIDTKFLA
jgi:mRNA interferase MazF